jgi:MinD-like ATPase involved in chromosome partitioning or flagellar assembly
MPFLLSAPKSPASIAVGQLAVRLEQGVSQSVQAGGFFNRMSKWFRK